MEEVKLSEIPEYLTDGELFKTLVENSEDPNEILTFDASVLKKNTKVESALECDHLLNSLRFWGVSKFCEEIAAFVLIGPSEENDQVLAKYEEQFPYARALLMIDKTFGKKNKAKNQVRDAIAAGCVEVVEYLLKGKNVLPQLDACCLAARAGHVKMLAFVHQRGYVLSSPVANEAVAHGHVDCLEYAHRNGVKLSDELLLAAARAGSIVCMEYLYNNRCRWPGYVCSSCAAQNGHFVCLRYAHENGCP